MKETFKVVEVTVQPNVEPISRVINPAMPRGKAIALRDKLEEKAIQGDFDPNKVITYLVETA